MTSGAPIACSLRTRAPCPSGSRTWRRSSAAIPSCTRSWTSSARARSGRSARHEIPSVRPDDSTMTPGGPIAILAGSGQLPVQLVKHLERTGQEYRVLAFRGFASPELRRQSHASVDLLDLKSIMSTLEGWRPRAVSLVGAVRRPGFSALLGAYSLLRNRQEVKDVISRGDDQVLRGAVRLLEERGHHVVGAHELAPGLLAAPDLRGSVSLSGEDRDSVDLGLNLLEALSAF